MRKISIKYGDFHKLYQATHHEVDYYVQTHRREYALVNASVEKDAEMLDIEFSNGYKLTAAKEHAFMNLDGESILAKDLKHNTRILTIHGSIYVTSIKSTKENKAYDINIDAPHWYINDESGGIIHHNTLFGLVICKAYLDQHPDAMMIFYDSEGGASQDYFESVGIDLNRVLYFPIMSIEDLKFDMIEKLEAVREEVDKNKEDVKFIWFIDSLGNLASNKEIDDAVDKKSVADMTRAKAMKSFFRVVTPYFKNYNMSLITIQHTYQEIGGMGAPRQIVAGGTGNIYSADEIFTIGKRQIREGSQVVGWQFILNIEKSRSIRERAAIPFDVTYDDGIDKYSGLLDIALITGHVEAPSQGWYSRPSVEEDKRWRRRQTSTSEFWDPLLQDETFKAAVTELYKIGGSSSEILKKSLDEMIQEGMVDEDTGEVL